MKTEGAVGQALYRAGLTSYPYATAEILRFLRELEDHGYSVVLSGESRKADSASFWWPNAADEHKRARR